MNAEHSGKVLVWGALLVLCAALSLGVAAVALASSSPAESAQPRPTLTPTPPAPTVGPTMPPTPAAPAAASGAGCESICGRVINLADSSGVAGVTVRFGDSGWGLDTQTDSTGAYGYGRLGLDVGWLNAVLAEGSGLHPATHDVAFAPPAGQVVFINLGVYPGERALRPPIVPTVSVSPQWAKRGGQVVYTVKVHNPLNTAISGVWVTDLLPTGLNLAGVSSDRGDVIRSGNYAAVHTGGLGAGEVMTVSIYADVSADAPTGALDNTVSLIYSEHAAAQAAARLYIQTGDSVPVAFPVTGVGRGLSVFGVGGGLVLALWLIRRLRLHRPGTTTEDKSG